MAELLFMIVDSWKTGVIEELGFLYHTRTQSPAEAPATHTENEVLLISGKEENM